MPTSHPASAGRVSLRDVARAVGVSHVTVSLALRGESRISTARRAEIVRVAARLGYRPDPMLSSLAAYRQRKRVTPIQATIGWLNQWPHPAALRRLREFDAFWHGAEATAARIGFRLEEFVIDATLSPARLQEILLARGVQGLLLPPHPDGLAFEGFDWGRHSIVRLGTSVPHPRAHVVSCDQTECAGLAYAQVHARGYRRIGFVSSPRFDRNTRSNFRAGFLRAQADHAPAAALLQPLLIEEGDTPGNARELERWLHRERPDALVSSHADLAPLLQKLGVRVPRDLAVAATSVLDGKFSAGIDQNCAEIGAVALRTLAGLIHQNELGIPALCRRVVVEGRWVDGASLPVAKPDRRQPARYKSANR